MKGGKKDFEQGVSGPRGRIQTHVHTKKSRASGTGV